MAQSQYQNDVRKLDLAQFNQQQTDLVFFQSQTSIGSEVIIEISQKDQRNKKFKTQLDKFIETYYTQGNMKIIVKCPATLGERQQKQDKENFNLLKYSVNQISISEDEKLFQQRIYLFKGQPENNIQPLIEMIIYTYNYIPYFRKEIKEIGGEIQMNYQGYYLQIPPGGYNRTDDNELHQFFSNTVCYYLDNQIILQIECFSNAEANSKYNLLKKEYIKTMLGTKLNCQIQSIVILKFEELKHIFQNQVEQLNMLLKNSQVYLLIQRTQNSIEELQIKLNDLLKTKEYFRKETQIEKIPFYDLPSDINEIQTEIDKLKNQYQNIDIEISQGQMEDSKPAFQITFTTWLQKDERNQEFQKYVKEIKTQIEKICLPFKTITINSKQKDVWENYLQEIFEKYSSCFTAFNKGDAIEILIKTNQEKWREFEKQIQDKLNRFICQIIKIPCRFVLNQNFKDFQQKKKLFKQIFRKIFSEFEDNISVTLWDQFEQNFHFQVVYDKKKIREQEIKNILVNQFINNLKDIQRKFPYYECLYYFEIQIPELINKNNIYVHQTIIENEPNTIFLGLKEDLQQLDQHLKDIGQRFQKNWVEQVIDVDNKLLFQCLESKYQMKELILKQGTTIEFLKNTTHPYKILIKGFQNQVIDLLKQLQSLEIKIMQSVQIKSTNFNHHQIKQLSEMSQKLSDIEKITSTYFEIKKTTSFKPQKAILSKLTFEGKELCIVKGDITQIECQAIVNQILNDKCELGDVEMQNQQVKNLLKITNNEMQEFFKKIIQEKNTLQPGDLFYQKVTQKCHIDHIFNIYPPTYRQSKYLSRELNIIRQLIKTIFQLAREKQIKQIAFPVISTEIFGFYFTMASQTLLMEIINNLFQESCQIEQIYILEDNDLRCRKIIGELQRLLSKDIYQKPITQQWQWFEQDHYEDYDEYEINKKICQMYKKFQSTGINQNFKIKYPYSKYPGTHLIDLDQQKIWDKTHNNSEQSIISIDNCGQRRYYIDGKEVNEDLNRYLIQQEIQKKRKFEIFYKFYEIFLTSNGHYQKNLQHGNTRNIQFIPYDEPNLENVLIIQNSQFKFEHLIEPIEDKSQNLCYIIDPKKSAIYDQIKIYTLNEDENAAEQQLFDELSSLTEKKRKLGKLNYQSSQQSTEGSEKLSQVSSPRRLIQLTKKVPLQQKN
ncbi:unnamed protein product [Paramecium sonneborni]|uniref:Macro domain-containing protein n=1 Tax=Paramecium sonneborni TaxID=65129 RepID=A0A8S1RA84_9CILI|nr:unnamed protein product [Paramecium sonneborni]